MKTYIIMCTWKRIERLPITIELLEKQTNKDFTFCIWNNNSDIKDKIIDITNKSTLKIEVNNSTENIGGIGRF
jgi:hypothetical protein